MQRGYIKIWRKIEDSGLLQMHGTLALFMYMVLHAMHKPVKVGTSIGAIQLDRGQFITGIHQLASSIKLSVQQTRTALDYLKTMEIITSKSTNKFTIYTIVNYENYQDVNTIPTNNETIKQQTDNKQITTKEELKNVRIKTETVFSDNFDKFWMEWPASKRKGGKKECLKVWTSNHLDGQTEVILNHVKYCKGNGIWRDEQYIEAPVVYLRAFKWDGAEFNQQQNNQFSGGAVV